MKYHSLSLREAFDFVKQKRPIIQPNNGLFVITFIDPIFFTNSLDCVFFFRFMLQLVEYEKRLYPDKPPTMKPGDWEVKGVARNLNKNKTSHGPLDEKTNELLSQFIPKFLTSERLQYERFFLVFSILFVFCISDV
jgi:hypothetical protein